ncbi:MAG: hypothetical protein WC216_00380 [Gallionella sp.]|jgi:hypothetical protein
MNWLMAFFLDSRHWYAVKRSVRPFFLTVGIKANSLRHSALTFSLKTSRNIVNQLVGMWPPGMSRMAWQTNKKAAQARPEIPLFMIITGRSVSVAAGHV